MHTPRLWEYDPDSDFHNDPSGIAYVDLSAGDSPKPASRFARVDKGPTAKDDAQLIALAPNLLDALKELELRTRQYIAGDLVTFPVALLPQVRALIAEAEPTPEPREANV